MEQLANGRVGLMPDMDSSAMTELSRYPWPGNVRELRNVLERAMVMFPQQAVSSNQVRENLLRMKAPDRNEEMNALWQASQGLSGIDLAQEAASRHCRILHITLTGSAISTISTFAATFATLKWY